MLEWIPLSLMIQGMDSYARVATDLLALIGVG